MTMLLGPSLYMQTTLDDDDFVANFVARQEALEALLRRLRSATAESGDLHQILVGARGMGKTSMLRRVAIAIDQEPGLAERYVPLSFREEQYNVLSLGDFWRNCGEALAAWAEATGRVVLAQRLDGALPSAAWAGDYGAAECFGAEMTALQRQAVLLVDNVDLILDALSGNDRWILRRHLQRRDGPVVLGAASRALAESADYSDAFYEFFQPTYLEPLDMRETEGCVRALALAHGEHGKPVIAVLHQQPERLRTLHALTGGNPRVLVLIYRLLAATQSDAAMGDLEILLDQVTPYYKARVEEYQTAQQRAVVDAIALHWDPITTGELARVTGIAATTLSPLLIRLRRDGLIENVQTSGTYAGHQFVERFFNIWYLMRHGSRRAKQKMRWLVAFLSSFYSGSELTAIERHARETGAAERWNSDFAFAIREALERLGSASAGSEIDERLSEAKAIMREASKTFRMRDFIGSQTKLDEIVTRFANGEGRPLQDLVTTASYISALTSTIIGNQGAALVGIAATMDRLADAKHPNARAMAGHMHFVKAIIRGEMGDGAGAIAGYDDVVAQFAGAQDSTSRELVAKALGSKAAALIAAGDYATALKQYADIVSRFGDAQEAALQKSAAEAQFGLALAFALLGDTASAIAGYHDLIVRHADEPSLRQTIAESRISLGVLLMDSETDPARAESLYLDAASVRPLDAQAHLIWLYLLGGRVSEAVILRGSLNELAAEQLALLDSAIELARDNFGSSTMALTRFLDDALALGDARFSLNFARLLRLAGIRGYGERLLAWLEETGLAERVAPFYAAYQAYIRGEDQLRDVNPEIRRPAGVIYDWLDRQRQRPVDTPKTKRGKRDRSQNTRGRNA
jgi:hypothetical protein